MKKIFLNLFNNTVFHKCISANRKIRSGALRQIPYKIEVIAEKLDVPVENINPYLFSI